jgi:hypothetical protein
MGRVFLYMPRNHITKDEMKVLILKQKHKLLEEPYYTSDPKAVASKHLNELLDRLDEFRY